MHRLQGSSSIEPSTPSASSSPLFPWIPLALMVIAAGGALWVGNNFLATSPDWSWIADGSIFAENMATMWALGPAFVVEIALIGCLISHYCCPDRSKDSSKTSSEGEQPVVLPTLVPSEVSTSSNTASGMGMSRTLSEGLTAAAALPAADAAGIAFSSSSSPASSPDVVVSASTTSSMTASGGMETFSSSTASSAASAMGGDGGSSSASTTVSISTTTSVVIPGAIVAEPPSTTPAASAAAAPTQPPAQSGPGLSNTITTSISLSAVAPVVKQAPQEEKRAATATPAAAPKKKRDTSSSSTVALPPSAPPPSLSSTQVAQPSAPPPSLSSRVSPKEVSILTGAAPSPIVVSWQQAGKPAPQQVSRNEDDAERTAINEHWVVFYGIRARGYGRVDSNRDSTHPALCRYYLPYYIEQNDFRRVDNAIKIGSLLNHPCFCLLKNPQWTPLGRAGPSQLYRLNPDDLYKMHHMLTVYTGDMIERCIDSAGRYVNPAIFVFLFREVEKCVKLGRKIEAELSLRTYSTTFMDFHLHTSIPRLLARTEEQDRGDILYSLAKRYPRLKEQVLWHGRHLPEVIINLAQDDQTERRVSEYERLLHISMPLFFAAPMTIPLEEQLPRFQILYNYVQPKGGRFCNGLAYLATNLNNLFGGYQAACIEDPNSSQSVVSYITNEAQPMDRDDRWHMVKFMREQNEQLRNKIGEEQGVLSQLVKQKDELLLLREPPKEDNSRALIPTQSGALTVQRPSLEVVKWKLHEVYKKLETQHMNLQRDTSKLINRDALLLSIEQPLYQTLYMASFLRHRKAAHLLMRAEENRVRSAVTRIDIIVERNLDLYTHPMERERVAPPTATVSSTPPSSSSVLKRVVINPQFLLQ